MPSTNPPPLPMPVGHEAPSTIVPTVHGIRVQFKASLVQALCVRWMGLPTQRAWPSLGLGALSQISITMIIGTYTRK